MSQEELLRQPVYIPHRPLKDPRDILMLDPACGSMHFGLYAFDLYERLYDEAWELEERLGPDAFLRADGLLPLRESYPDKTAFLADVPRLIIERNIHGIDIDPRAVQIAGLSLWLRAQRSWQAQGVKPQDRPQIRRSNIVCAEPMPGDRALLEEFLKSLRDDRLEALIRRVLKAPANQQVRATKRMADALCDLVRTVWEEMKLAGEAGSLLKIEETLANAVTAAEAEWSERMPLFRVVEFDLTRDADRVRYPRGVPGEDGADFWQRAEALVLAALEEYAEQAQNGAGYQRRLFVDDAARGFSFIDLCRKRYDVAVMNPPFGEASAYELAYLGIQFPHWNSNLLCAFLQRCWDWCAPRGCVGLIYDRTAVVKSTYGDFRRHALVPDDRLFAMADLGWEVLDANVEVTTSVIHHNPRRFSAAFTDLRTVSPGEKGKHLRDRLMALQIGASVSGFVFRRGSTFTLLPNAVLGYDFPEFLQAAFLQQASLQVKGFQAYQGHALKADKHFRLWWEITATHRGITHRLFNGSGYSPYHTALLDCLVAPCSLKSLPKDSATVLRNTEFHGSPGVCFGKRGDFFSAHVLPAGHVFTVEGQSIPITQPDRALELLGFLNTPLVRLSLNKYCGQHKYSGYVNLLPYVPFDDVLAVRKMVHDALLSGAKARQFDEIQSLFCPGIFGHSVAQCADQLRSAIESANSATLQCEEFCHEQSLAAFGVLPKEREIIEAFRTRQPMPESPIEDTSYGDDCQWFSAHTLTSVMLGSIFGRWDIRFATGKKQAPNLPDPFAPLPACPPGMLQNAHGLPAAPADVPADYPLRISWPGILVDDPGHPEDIEARVRDALRVIGPDNADAIEQEACQILGVSSLRDYFANPNRFFDDHLKRYSKSRRQAPIYWPLSTPSGSYTLWLYYHRLSDQTLYTCVNDFVDPKLAVVSGQLAVLRRKSGRSREEERDLEQLTDLEVELKDFRAELLRVAAFWKPNLKDGVQITAALLWRLFRHRPWQKTLKETWESLERGDYDWAHLAMSIWPGRVVPKCVSDRSLAIAHDVEDLLWVEDGGRWRNLRSPAEEIEAQKARQRSPAQEQLRVLLGELTMGRARGLRSDEVVEQLASGQWDDLEVTLLLWPERMAEKCWDDPLLAVTLRVNLPTKLTKAARERFVKERVEAGCPDLAEAVIEALRDRPDRFSAFWSELARGDRDDLALALALWPARVVEKCAVDVTLAERHGLRRFLWVGGHGGGWGGGGGGGERVSNEVAWRRNY